MYPGMKVSPEKMAAAMEVGSHLTMEIIKYPKQGKMDIVFTKINPEEPYDIAQVVEALSMQLANGFAQTFGIKGKMITRT